MKLVKPFINLVRLISKIPRLWTLFEKGNKNMPNVSNHAIKNLKRFWFLIDTQTKHITTNENHWSKLPIEQV